MKFRDLKIGQKFDFKDHQPGPDSRIKLSETSWKVFKSGNTYRVGEGYDLDSEVYVTSSPLVRVPIESVPLGTLVSLDAIGPVEHKVVETNYGVRLLIVGSEARHQKEPVYVPAVQKPLKEFKVGDKVLLSCGREGVRGRDTIEVNGLHYLSDTLATAVS